MLHYAGSADPYAYHRFRFRYAVEGAGHKGVIIYRVAEHDQLRAADGVVGRRLFRSFFHHAAHLRHCVHVDAGFRRAYVDRRTNHFRRGQRFRNGCDQIAVAFGVALVHQSAETADKVYAHFVSRPVQRPCQRHIIGSIAAFANHGNRRHGNTLVNDGHAQVRLDIFPGPYQLFRFLCNFVINFIRADFHIRMPAVPQADAHGDGTHVQVVMGDHLRRFQHIIKG